MISKSYMRKRKGKQLQKYGQSMIFKSYMSGKRRRKEMKK